MANKSEKEKREDKNRDKEIQTSKEEIKLNDLFQDLYKKISMNTHDIFLYKSWNKSFSLISSLLV